MKRIEKKHLLAIRWLHWINFPLLFLMIWSGLLIYWANSVYGIRLFGYELFHFFPKWFFETFGIPQRLAEGMALHFFFMWFFIVNGVLYVLYTFISGEWRALVPVPASFKRALQVTLYDMRLSKYHPPQGKYNDAQRIAYAGVILMGVGSALTGLAIYKPVQFGWLTWALGGYEWARWEHFWLTILYVLFFITHVAQVVRAGWNNFRSMITGYEVATVEGVPIENTKLPDAAPSEGKSA
ncbi:MAG: cytochrome b/b6 domain-containing protein [Pyrinomonadaceae bacterium]